MKEYNYIVFLFAAVQFVRFESKSSKFVSGLEHHPELVVEYVWSRF